MSTRGMVDCQCRGCAAPITINAGAVQTQLCEPCRVKRQRDPLGYRAWRAWSEANPVRSIYGNGGGVDR